MHALYIRTKFDRGEREIREGKGISHEEVRRTLQKLYTVHATGILRKTQAIEQSIRNNLGNLPAFILKFLAYH